MELPAKLKSDLLKSPDAARDQFVRFLTACEVLFPGFEVRSQKRYSALYAGPTPIMYIEPQYNRILLGFYSTFIHRYRKSLPHLFTDFPQWSSAHGTLVGYSFCEATLPLVNAVGLMGRLLYASYEGMVDA